MHTTPAQHTIGISSMLDLIRSDQRMGTVPLILSMLVWKLSRCATSSKVVCSYQCVLLFCLWQVPYAYAVWLCIRAGIANSKFSMPIVL